jgi:hypothetical protein
LLTKLMSPGSAMAGEATITAGAKPIAPATATARIRRTDLEPRSANGTEPLVAAWASG